MDRDRSYSQSQFRWIQNNCELREGIPYAIRASGETYFECQWRVEQRKYR